MFLESGSSSHQFEPYLSVYTSKTMFISPQKIQKFCQPYGEILLPIKKILDRKCKTIFLGKPTNTLI